MNRLHVRVYVFFLMNIQKFFCRLDDKSLYINKVLLEHQKALILAVDIVFENIRVCFLFIIKRAHIAKLGSFGASPFNL